jgi:hypothetical protein
VKSFVIALLVGFVLTGCAVSQGPRIAGSETSDVAPPDILIAFGDAKCAPCRRNKPTLEAWDRSGRYEVIFLEGWMGTITVPYYVVTRDGHQIYSTNNINDL